jgi:hypothetical protein
MDLHPLYETCYFFTFSQNDDVVSLFRETCFAETGHFAKQRNKRNDPPLFREKAKRVSRNISRLTEKMENHWQKLLCALPLQRQAWLLLKHEVIQQTLI